MLLRKFVNHRFFYILFFAVVFLWLYKDVITKTSDTFQGAFWGFIVGIVTLIFSKYMELQARRYNVLVYLEQELNASINDLSDNKFQIDKILEADQLTLLFPCELKLTEEYIKQLGRTELKNDIFGLYIDFRKYNHNIKMAIEIYERNVSSFKDFESQKFARTNDIEGVLTVYHSYFKTHLKEINTFGDKINECIKDCLVKVRFFAKVDKTLLASNIGQPYYDKNDFQKWLIEDKKRLEKEMEETIRKDDEERKRVQKTI